MELYKRYNSNKRMVTVKKYRDRYKVTIHKSLKIKGLIENKGEKITLVNGMTELYDDNVEYTNIQVYVDDLTGEEYYVYDVEEKKKIQKQENPEKLANSISRSRSTIYELALCNDWDYFVTLTLNQEKYNRYDLKKFHKELTQHIRDLNKKYKCKIEFLLIPEQHKDGAWHMHGFLRGLPDEIVLEFKTVQFLPDYLRKKIENGEKIYTWTTYQKKFGFCDLEPIKSIYKASAYITKYVSKSLCESITELNAQTYYCSRGLNRAKEIKRGYIDMPVVDGIEMDFENDYLKIMWCDSEKWDNLKFFIDNVI